MADGVVATVSGTLDALFVRVDRALANESLAIFLEEQAHEYVRSVEKNRFASEGDALSGQWAPLADSTIEDRVKQGYGAGPILQRTGELYDYVVESAPTIVPFPGGVAMDLPGDTSNPVLLKKLTTAQKGAGKVPARPVIGIGETDAMAITDLLGVSLHAQIAGL